jgi:hypothetical protein
MQSMVHIQDGELLSTKLPSPVKFISSVDNLKDGLWHWVSVTQACNPSYSRSRDQEDRDQEDRASQGK